MPFAFRVSLLALTFGLSFVLALPRAQAATFRAAQTTDAEAVRALTEKYGQAIAAGNLATLRALWNPSSPHLTARLRYYQGLFVSVRVEVLTAQVTRLEVTGDRAVSHLTADERPLDKKTGAVLSERDAFHGLCRAFEWVRTNAGWQIEREFSVQAELAASLDDAASARARDELLEKERVFVTDALVNALGARGQRHLTSGAHDKALHCFDLERAVAERIGDRAGVAAAWLNTGVTKRGQGDYEQALLYLHKARAEFEAAKLPRGVALVLEKLAWVQRARGAYQQAFDYAQKSLRLYEALGNRLRITDALTELAYIYQVQNNYPQALSHLEKALALAQERRDILRVAILRHDIAVQHQLLGNHEQALALYQELLRQSESHGDRGGAAQLRRNIARVRAAQGRYDEALADLRQALAEFEATGQRRDILAALNDLSSVHLAQEKYTAALPLAERAVALARESWQPLNLWFALTTLGYSQLALQQPAAAQQSFTEAVALMEDLREQTAGGVEERQRYFANRLHAHHGLLKLLVRENRPLEALVFAERTKARVLLDVLQTGRVSSEKAMNAAEREQESRLKADLTRLNRQLAHASQSRRPAVSDLQAQLEKARLAYEAFQTTLHAAHPALKIQRGEAPVIAAEELAALLPTANSALLEYVVTEAATYLFVITKAPQQNAAATQVFTLPLKQAELAQKIEVFRRQLAGRDLGFRATAAQLYELLLKPAQALLKGKTRLIIAPDDKLWELPFQALLTNTNRFLLQDAALSYAPSLTVLREMTKRRAPAAPAPSLLALGNPALTQATKERAALTLRDSKLAPLPEAEAEVKALGQLYGTTRSKVFIGPAAREDRVKAEAAAARVLHFATHGVLNDAAPMYSHLVLAAGDKDEDGLLEAWELLQMDLQADLAVLSACETARGRFGAGEGVIGLSWALFVAGVPTTVVSQWKVESAATRELMLAFHRQLQAPKHKTKAAALRQAALSVLKNPATSHPFYWAGFVLVGAG